MGPCKMMLLGMAQMFAPLHEMECWRCINMELLAKCVEIRPGIGVCFPCCTDSSMLGTMQPHPSQCKIENSSVRGSPGCCLPISKSAATHSPAAAALCPSCHAAVTQGLAADMLKQYHHRAPMPSTARVIHASCLRTLQPTCSWHSMDSTATLSPPHT